MYKMFFGILLKQAKEITNKAANANDKFDGDPGHHV